MDDSEEFFRLAGGERAAATMRFDCPHAWEESDQHLADYLSEGNCTFALGFQQEEKLFGVFAFKAEAESDSEDLSQMLVSEQRGHSLGNHIISDMVELPRTEKWYKALWVYIPKRNTASRRMVERSGFNEKKRRRYPCMTEDLAFIGRSVKKCRRKRDDKMILTEFDENKIAVINPDNIQRKRDDFPETVVSIFHHILFNKIVSFLNAKKIGESNDVDGTWPVYEAEYKGIRIGLVKARLGAAACVGLFEEIIAMGAKRIILLGNCGVLDKRIEDCGIIIPTKAIRDEGTSYHYVPASDYIQVNKNYGELFRKLLDEYGYNHVNGITWTTDAFFRETPEKIKRRKDMGAVCVEMECSAMQALCDFRDVEFFQFLYAGDNLDHPQWDPRSLNGYAKLTEKEKIAMLAVELAYRIAAEQS